MRFYSLTHQTCVSFFYLNKVFNIEYFTLVIKSCVTFNRSLNIVHMCMKGMIVMTHFEDLLEKHLKDGTYTYTHVCSFTRVHKTHFY